MTKQLDQILAKAKSKTSEVKKLTKPKVKKENKVKAKLVLSEDDIKLLLDKPFVKKIIADGGSKHLICFKLHEEGLNTQEIMAITKSPYSATKRNIWLYTSGKKLA